MRGGKGDLENVQPESLSGLDAEQFRVIVFVGSNQTKIPFELAQYAGRAIKFESNAEIIAKKMWHRGDQGKVREQLMGEQTAAGVLAKLKALRG